MAKRVIVIDVATIYPGKGGAGGGIWSYARNLLLHVDREICPNDNFEFICLVNKEFNLSLENMTVKVLNLNFQSFMFRLLYIHIYLPFYVLFKRALLHKLYFESPIYKSFKMLTTIHDCMGDHYKYRNYAPISAVQQLKSLYIDWINRRAIKISDCICTPSQFVKEELIERYNIPSQKVHVTPLATAGVINGIQSKKRRGQRINLYCIAAFYRHKGQLRLINIFERLIKDFTADVHLYFRGHVHDERYYQSIVEKVNSSGLEERVHFLKYDPNSSLEEIYADADWVILLSEYEGFGLPVIEAQAKGTPVICSGIGTFKEVAGESVAYIEDNMDDRAAACELYALLTDENRKRRLVEMGFSNVTKYSWAQFALQMMEIYKMLTDQNEPGEKTNKRENSILLKESA